MSKSENQYFNREISWLSFNERVLQEAQDESVPLIERLRFLAIYSSNLDEFFRVRVASYRHLLRIQKKEHLNKRKSVKQLVRKISQTVDRQQQQFGAVFRNILIPELRKKNIFLIDQSELDSSQVDFLRNYFDQEIAHHLEVLKLGDDSAFLENKGLYFIVQHMQGEGMGAGVVDHYLINIPNDKTSRFIVVPGKAGRHIVIQLQDVLRLFLSGLLPEGHIESCFAIKLTRDAQLYLEDEIEGSILDKIKASLYKRKIGSPTRLLYDENMPKPLVRYIRKAFGLERDDLIPGGRYHNFNDFFAFPFPPLDELTYEPFPGLQHPDLRNSSSIMDAIAEQDHILHFPYQSYNDVVRLLMEAAEDPLVEVIKITLYRVSGDSAICQALIKAAVNGKSIFVFNEIKARFDEESNIYWGEKMQEAGITVSYGYEDLKVHSKVCLIYRKEEAGITKYAYFGTGNFNEKTAGIYGDHALLTKDERLTADLDQVFHYLETDDREVSFEHLLVAPFNMRSRFLSLVDHEISNASKGLKAEMILKMNSLEDREMIDKLYEASRAGVKVQLIIRGICCLIPGVEGMSEHIEITSIVDRYLEHARVYIFHNAGKETMYLASADWMRRNLSRRVEVGFPIYDERLKSELRSIIDLQLHDNVKARHIDAEQSNIYKSASEASPDNKKIRAQFDTYYWLKERLK